MILSNPELFKYYEKLGYSEEESFVLATLKYGNTGDEIAVLADVRRAVHDERVVVPAVAPISPRLAVKQLAILFEPTARFEIAVKKPAVDKNVAIKLPLNLRGGLAGAVDVDADFGRLAIDDHYSSSSASRTASRQRAGTSSSVINPSRMRRT